MFVIAATGNYANYVSYKKKHSATSSTVQVWYSNVDKVQRDALHSLHCPAVNCSCHHSRLFSSTAVKVLNKKLSVVCIHQAASSNQVTSALLVCDAEPA